MTDIKKLLGAKINQERKEQGYSHDITKRRDKTRLFVLHSKLF